MTVKKIGIYRRESSYDELKNKCVISQGWGDDLSFLYGESIDKIDDALKALYKTDEQRLFNAFRNLLHYLRAGDIVLAFEGNSLSGIAEIPENFVYYYDDEIDGYPNCLFPVNWINWNDFCKGSKLENYKQNGKGIRGIENCGLKKINDYIKDNWEQYKKDNNIEVQPSSCQEKLESLINNFEERKEKSRKDFYNKIMNSMNNKLFENAINLLKTNRNLILSGAPGTGKTYLAKQIAAQMILEKVYDEETASEDEKKKMKEQCGFVQFHPSYDYTDFVEGLRPVNKDGQLVFERKDGSFMEFCRRALDSYNNALEKTNAPKYVFIIDEINRGEISKIFGELFFSIDPGYRGEKGRVMTQYNNLIEEGDVFKNGFYVPENVYIIGTMNDIDRSVESMDFAFRRRFAFKEIGAEERTIMLDEKIPEQAEKAKKRMNDLNSAIENIDGLSKAYHIGPAYFLKLKNYLTSDGKANADIWESLWDNHLDGLLREYLRGMPNVEDKLDVLKKAYNDESDSSKG